MEVSRTSLGREFTIHRLIRCIKNIILGKVLFSKLMGKIKYKSLIIKMKLKLSRGTTCCQLLVETFGQTKSFRDIQILDAAMSSQMEFKIIQLNLQHLWLENFYSTSLKLKFSGYYFNDKQLFIIILTVK